MDEIVIQLGIFKFNVTFKEGDDGKLDPITYIRKDTIENLKIKPVFCRQSKIDTSPVFIDARRQEAFKKLFLHEEVYLHGLVRVKMTLHGRIIHGIFVPINSDIIEAVYRRLSK